MRKEDEELLGLDSDEDDSSGEQEYTRRRHQAWLGRRDEQGEFAGDRKAGYGSEEEQRRELSDRERLVLGIVDRNGVRTVVARRRRTSLVGR